MSRQKYSDLERQYVIDLVKTKSILQSRKTDMGTNLLKRKAWENITDDFNSKFKRKVSRSKINQLYRKMKTTARTEISKNKRSIAATGGGSNAAQISDISNQISGIESDLTFTIDNDFDDDFEESSVIRSGELEAESDQNLREVANAKHNQVQDEDQGTKSGSGESIRKQKQPRRIELMLIEHEKRMSVLEKQDQVYDAQLALAQRQIETEIERKKYFESLQVRTAPAGEIVYSEGQVYRRL